MNKKKWKYLTPGQNQDFSLLIEAGYPRLISLVLSNRNISSPSMAEDFFSPVFSQLHDPWLLPDMEKGIYRVMEAIKNKEKIMIYGDYDVDGCTGTTLLYSSFKKLGADVSYYLPHRIDEGYGLHLSVIKEFARAGVNLIVTIDCGTSNIKEIDCARENGIDVIVIDHHEPDEENLPSACALINPKLKYSLYPCSFLAGVGVGFKFVQALSDRAPAIDWKDYLGLTALGTIADIVPMIGENRSIAFLGLEAINRGPSCGLKALMDISSTEVLDTNGVLFRIAPRINALGRLDNANLAVEMLLSTDINEALPFARIAEERNNERKFIQNNIMEEALFKLRRKGFKSDKSPIILFSHGWHIGVLGIVASKLVENFYRPVYLMMSNGQEAKGSARGIEGFSIFDSLSFCHDILNKFGGHALAGGFSLNVSSIEEFSEKLECYVRDNMTDDILSPVIRIEGEAQFSEIDLKLAQWLKSMEPFGIENSVPFFSSQGVKVLNSKFMGRDDEHIKLILHQGDFSHECVGFKMGKSYSHLVKPGSIVDIVYSIDINYWRNEPILRLTARDFRPAQRPSVTLSIPRLKPIDDCYEFLSSEEKLIIDDLAREKKVIASFSDFNMIVKFLHHLILLSLRKTKRLVIVNPLRLEANRYYLFLKSHLRNRGIKVFLLTGTLNTVERERIVETLKADFPCLVITTFDYLSCYKSFFFHRWKTTDIAVIDDNLLDYAGSILIQLEDICNKKGFLFLTLNSILKSPGFQNIRVEEPLDYEIIHSPSFIEKDFPVLKGKTVMFFSHDSEIEDRRELFSHIKSDFSCEVISGKNKYREKMKILEDFKDGKFDTLLVSSSLLYELSSFSIDNIVMFNCPYTWNEFSLRLSLAGKIYLAFGEEEMEKSLTMIKTRVPDRSQLIKCYQILRSYCKSDMMNLLSSEGLTDEIGPELLKTCLTVFEEIGLYRIAYQRTGYGLKLLDHKKKLDLLSSPCYLECLKLREHFDKLRDLILNRYMVK